MTQTNYKMSKRVKKDSRGDRKALPSSTGIHSETPCHLRRLQALLAKSNHKQEVSGRTKAVGSRFHSPHPPKDNNGESAELEKFSVTYSKLRCFSSHPSQKLFADILTLLVNNRLCSDWIELAPPDWALRVLLCLRLLNRDPQHQKMFHLLQGVQLVFGAFLDTKKNNILTAPAENIQRRSSDGAGFPTTSWPCSQPAAQL
ncbi:serine/threonine-protein kinase Nek10 isoform X2 [Syngnathus typhle]|uniref:serine/threonine-protein kinase Nek10 isoform X2 n=1 Tax=Syngnathus typhle TaxID=161592 RepID=UPI002A6A3D47|nr:serine/threonine-protein kinase Nek10 isoform X2 [Syngnathus typhle]